MHTHISRDDRIVIADGLRRKETLSFIAGRIRKDKGSVSREIKRNSSDSGEYFAPSANRLARERRKNSKQKYRLIENDINLSRLIEEKLEPLVSPEVIAHEFGIHHQTVYFWLYRTRLDLLPQLPQRCRKR